MGICMKHTLLLQEILHLEGLDKRTAERLHKTLKGDAAGVTFEKLVIFMASVVKVSCKGPMWTALHCFALPCKQHSGSFLIFKLGLMSMCRWSWGLWHAGTFEDGGASHV